MKCIISYFQLAVTKSQIFPLRRFGGGRGHSHRPWRDLEVPRGQGTLTFFPPLSPPHPRASSRLPSAVDVSPRVHRAHPHLPGVGGHSLTLTTESSSPSPTVLRWPVSTLSLQPPAPVIYYLVYLTTGLGSGKCQCHEGCVSSSVLGWTRVSGGAPDPPATVDTSGMPTGLLAARMGP